MRGPSIAASRFATGTSSTSARSCGSGSSPDPGTHLHPPVVCAGGGGGAAAGRCSPAGRCCTGRPGRPDLLGAAHAAELCTRPVRVGAPPGVAELPEDADVYLDARVRQLLLSHPGMRGVSSSDHRPVGAGRNPALVLAEQRYVRELLAGLDAYPAYYALHGPRRTRAGPPGPDLNLPHRADSRTRELRRRIEAGGEWVVDLRARRALPAAGQTWPERSASTWLEAASRPTSAG